MKKFFKEASLKYTPRAWNISEPVAQVFVNKDGIRSYYSFTNFPSLFSPKTATNYFYDVKIYDTKGKPAITTEIDVPAMGTNFFDPVQIFGSNLPEVGMITARIKPPSIFYNADKHLGKLTSHFYVMFGNENMESVGVVHPQVKLKKAKDKYRPWQSNQFIETRGLKKIRNIQLNPTNKPLTSNITLVDEAGREIATQTNIIPAYGSAENIWDNFGGSKVISFKIDRLGSPNAKPLLFLHFDDNSFTVSHS